jgi:hypothetical protein
MSDAEGVHVVACVWHFCPDLTNVSLGLAHRIGTVSAADEPRVGHSQFYSDRAQWNEILAHLVL